MRKLVCTALAATLAALPLASLTGCNNSSSSDNEASGETPKVVIGTLATEDILPMWVAEDENLFSEAGIEGEVTVFQSATELIAAVSAGEVDYAMTDPMVTASIYASGTDVEIEWVTLGADASQGRFGIMTADSSITSLTDLAGVEVGVGSNTILEYVLDTLMERAGVPDDQIVTSEMQKLPVRYEAMASGQVKAAALPASLLALGEANGCIVVADDTQGENISQSVMIARSDYLASDAGKTVKEAIEQVWNKATSEINASPENYRSLLVEKANLSDAIAQTYPISTYPTCALPEQTQVDNILTWMKKKGYLADGITYDASSGTFSGR